MSELRSYWHGFRTTLQTRLEYRADFFLGMLGSLGAQATSLAMLWVVLHHKPDLAGWRWAEIGALVAMTTMVLGVSELFFNHVWWTPAYIIRGQFDRLLVYPVRSLPFFLVTCPELHALGNIGGGLAMLVYFGREAQLPPWGLILLPWWIACGSLIYTAVLVMAASVVVRVKGYYYQLFWLSVALLQNSRYPVGVFPASVQLLLLFLIPFSAFNFIPISALTGRLPLWLGIVAPGAAAGVFTGLAFWSWNSAFRHYESTGS